MNRKQWAKAVDQRARLAAEKGQAALDLAVVRISPYVEEATRIVEPYVQKASKAGAEYADEARKVVGPMAHDLLVKGAAMAAETLDTLQPRLDAALSKVTPAVEDTVSKVAPAIEDALARVAPAVEKARGKVQHDLIPKFSEALHEAAEHPVARETAKRISLATAALAGELEIATPQPVVVRRSPLRKVGTFLLVGAAVAGVAYVVKKMLSTESSGWEAHEPSAAYVADPVASVVDDLTSLDLSAGEADIETPSDAVPEVALADDGEAQVSNVVVPLPMAAPGEDDDDAKDFADSDYGEGSYVGAEPPEGYDIKGNDRSMKYHVPGSSYYERTNADVWFNSPEAAETAGFTRASN